MSQEIVYRSPLELVPHPRNGEFFSDITDPDDWNGFVESVRDRGVLNPLIITQMDVVVSGHQRLRAALELALKEVPCIVMYDSADENAPHVLLTLIDTNIRQRGGCSGMTVKQQMTTANTISECTDRIRWQKWKEWKLRQAETKTEAEFAKMAIAWEREKKDPPDIAAIRTELRIFDDELKQIDKERKEREAQRKTEMTDEEIDNNLTELSYDNSVNNLTMSVSEMASHVADSMGISLKQLYRINSLAKLCPELLDRVEEGQLPSAAAMEILSKLSPADQETFLAQLPTDITQKITRKEVEATVQRMKAEAKCELDAAQSRANLNESILKQRDKELKESRDRAAELQSEMSGLRSRLETVQRNSQQPNKEVEALRKQLEAKVAECEAAKRSAESLQQAFVNETMNQPQRQLQAPAVDPNIELFLSYADGLEDTMTAILRAGSKVNGHAKACDRVSLLVARLTEFASTYQTH